MRGMGGEVGVRWENFEILGWGMSQSLCISLVDFLEGLEMIYIH